jgi:hypothetical protein
VDLITNDVAGEVSHCARESICIAGLRATAGPNVCVSLQSGFMPWVEVPQMSGPPNRESLSITAGFLRCYWSF